MTYVCWIEVKSPVDEAWRRCERLGGQEDDVGTIYRHEGMHDSPLRFAESILDRYLLSVLRQEPRKDADVRVCVRLAGQPHDEPPALLRQVTREEIRHAYQRKVLDDQAKSVLSACHAVTKSHASVFQAVVQANELGLAQEATTEIVQDALGDQWAEDVTEAVALARAVRAAIARRPEVSSRTAVRVKDHLNAKIELFWSQEDQEAENQRERAWSETIQEYDSDLAQQLKSNGQEAAAHLITMLSDRFNVLTRSGAAATPQDLAPDALEYLTATVQRRAEAAESDDQESTAA